VLPVISIVGLLPVFLAAFHELILFSAIFENPEIL
jgi:hypothetical protein